VLAVAAPAEEEVRAKLERTIESALDVIYGEGAEALSFEEKQAKVRQLLESNYDVDVIIRRAIGRNWGLMNAEEQARVLELIKQLVVKAYVSGVSGAERPTVELHEAIAISSKRMEIGSTVVLDGKPVSIVYRLGRLESGWQIYDIVAENISVVANYRQQIDDHFRKSDGKALVSRLEELVAQDSIDEDVKI
jgi:phospholipid transport system substrate-binding protein